MEGTPFGRYRLVEVLGRGGMGEVWRAFDTGTERIVAVKVLPAHLAGDAGFQQRFLREAKAAASLNEPHVVPIYDFGEVDGRLFVAMRLVDGQDLQALLAYGPLDPGRAVAIIDQVAAALQAAHAIGLVHRDVKPSNILVTEDDFAYLIDFGIARAVGETGLTSTGATIGTWEYMAPERFEKADVDARSDVYSLTCVLYQALTGELPFPASSLEQLVAAHMMKPPPTASKLKRYIPAAMDQVIATGMSKNPAQRYATTKLLANAARGALTTPPRRALSSLLAATPTPEESRSETMESPPLQPESAPESVTEAASTVSAADAPTQRASSGAANRRHRRRVLTSHDVLPGSKRPYRRRQIELAGVTALAIVASTTVAVVAFTSRPSRHDDLPAGTSTITSAARWSPSEVAPISPPPDPRQRLLAVLPTGANCETKAPNVNYGPAALLEANCRPGWPIHQVTYVVYANAPAMNERFDFEDRAKKTYKNHISLSCPGMGPSPQNWYLATSPHQKGGRVTCGARTSTTPPIPMLSFTIDSSLVLGNLQAADGNIGSAFDWWVSQHRDG